MSYDDWKKDATVTDVVGNVIKAEDDWEPEPSIEDLIRWEREDSGCEATDGCWVEPDGRCQHGHDSWLIVLGLI